MSSLPGALQNVVGSVPVSVNVRSVYFLLCGPTKRSKKDVPMWRHDKLAVVVVCFGLACLQVRCFHNVVNVRELGLACDGMARQISNLVPCKG